MDKKKTNKAKKTNAIATNVTSTALINFHSKKVKKIFIVKKIAIFCIQF